MSSGVWLQTTPLIIQCWSFRGASTFSIRVEVSVFARPTEGVNSGKAINSFKHAELGHDGVAVGTGRGLSAHVQSAILDEASGHRVRDC